MTKTLKKIALLAVLSTIILSCKKDNNQFYASENQVQKVKNWYQNEQKNSSTVIENSKGETMKLSFNPEWDKLSTEKINGRTIMAVPVVTNLQKISSKSTRFNIIIEQEGDSFEYKVVSRESTSNTLKDSVNELYNLAFGNTISSKSDNSLSNTRVYSSNFEVTRIISEGPSGTNIIEGNRLDKMNLTRDTDSEEDIPVAPLSTNQDPNLKCYNWYLTTTYYDAYGNIVATEKTYITTTCETAPIDWIDNGDGGANEGIPEEIFNFDYGDLGESTSEHTGSEFIGEEIINGDTIIMKSVKWKYYDGITFSFHSTETGKVKLNGGAKEYIDFSHVGVYQNGFWALGSIAPENLVVNVGVVSPTRGRSYITHDVRFTPVISVTIPSTGITVNLTSFSLKNFASSASWDVEFYKN